MISGKYLKELREEHGLSQADLAGLAGISQAHIAKIEGGKVDPRLSTVNRILLILTKERDIVKCGDIMNRKIMSAKPDEPVKKIIATMKRFAISQMPVFQGKRVIGSIKEGTIIKHMDRRLNMLEAKDIMDEPFPIVSSSDTIDLLSPLLDFHQAVLVSERGKIVGIITKSDLIKASISEKR